MRIHEYLLKNNDRAFKYGEWDCFIFIQDYFKHVQGKTLVLNIGNYQSEKGYKEALKASGYRSILHYLNKNYPHIPIGFATKGCVVLKDGALGICDGRISWFLTKDGILPSLTIDLYKRAWRVNECLKP